MTNQMNPPESSNSRSKTPRTYSSSLIRFVGVFVHDLSLHPTTNAEDAAAIEKIVWSLKASNIRIWGRKTFPKLTERFRAPGLFPGRRLCAIHNNLATATLYNLHDLIMDEIKEPATFFCHKKLGNQYLQTYEDLNRIWNKDFHNPSTPTVTQLQRPLAEYELFQPNNCAGCCIRRIFSDPALVAVLIIAVRFKEFEVHTKEREIRDYLEVAWELLSEKAGHLVGTREGALRSREFFELEARKISNFSKSRGFKDLTGNIGTTIM